MKNFKSFIYPNISIVLLSLFLVSCGGGGSNAGPTDGTTGTNPANNDPNAAKWGSMIWDTDNWN